MRSRTVTIGKRIAIGLGIVLVFLVVVGVLNYTGVNGIVTNAGQVIEGNKLDGTLANKEVDHLAWASELTSLLNDHNVTELTVQTDEQKCGLGMWLYGDDRKAAEGLLPALNPLFSKIEKPHAELHRSAIEIKKHFSQADTNLPTYLLEKEIDHLKWKAKVEDLFLNNRSELEVTTDERECGLGQFLYGESGARVASSDPELARLIEDLKSPHAKLHNSAIAIQKVWRPKHPGLINTLRERLDDHRKWAATVAIALLTNKKIDVETDPKKCAFGQWLSGSECKDISAHWPEFATLVGKVSGHHDRLHATAVQIVNSPDQRRKTRLFEEKTSVELDAVAEDFRELIVLEEKEVQAAQLASDIFKTQTLPALAQTQSALSLLKDKAVAKLEGMNQARKIYTTTTLPALHDVQGLLRKIREEARRHIMTDEVMLGAAQGTKRNVVIVSVVAVLAGILLSFYISRDISSILKPISSELDEGASQVSVASDQVSGASQQLAEGASEQAASIEETSSSLEQMSSVTSQNAENADQADSLMRDVIRVVAQAEASMNKLTASMTEVSNASEQTSKIIKTIDGIAFQTNLLALNAAVEAARAGEAGAGFAVVADEVRNLAMRAADAAKNTEALIEGTIKKTNDGSDIVDQTNQEFCLVATNVKKVGTLVGEIAAASKEQAKGIEQINITVMELDKVVQQNAANAEESASASEEMNAQAEHMKHMVKDLLALVGANRGGNGHSAGNQRKRLFLDQKTLSVSNRTGRVGALPVRNVFSAKEVRPERLIPLEEDDLREI